MPHPHHGTGLVHNAQDVNVDVDVEEIRAQTNNCLYARS